jgi:hypothetical protein
MVTAAAMLGGLFVLPGSAQAAGWSAAAWPATNFPRRIDVALSDCWSGTWERVQAQGITDQGGGLATGLSWWRSNRGNLATIKGWIGVLLAESGVLITRGPGTADDTQCGWVRSNVVASAAAAGAALTANGGTWPLWNNKTQFLAQLSFPTNYLDYTPYRGLSGCGYPYVTAQTLAGGTNYPPGRTNWVTLDYGVSRLPEILNALYATTVRDLAPSNSRAWGTGGGSTWADAKAASEANYSNRVDTWDGLAGSRGYGVWYPPEVVPPSGAYSYGAYIHNSVRTYRPDTMYLSGVTNQYEVYVLANHIAYAGFAGNPDVGTQVFDRIDFPASLGLTNYVLVGVGTNLLPLTIGSTNRPSTWCSDPGVNPAYGDGGGGYIFAKTLGSDINGGAVAIRYWNIPNGFRFY